MGFKDIEIKSSYETGEDDLVKDFYVPVLFNAVRYDRIAGFFSSTSLAVAARGIVGFLDKGERMRMLVCPKLNKEDVEILRLAEENPTYYLEEYFPRDIEISEDLFEQQHVNALGWLLAKGILEIRVAFVYKDGHLCLENEGIFHQKIGIAYDEEGNVISFSGSINESANGWLNNVEEFKVFRSWKSEQKEEYLAPDINKFESFWSGHRQYVEIYSLPQAAKNKLISYADNFNKEKILVKKYKQYSNYRKNCKELGLFNYQREAINKWKQNNYRLLFQMATGTGKTRTAIGGIVELLNELGKLIIIISCPQGTLSLQWKEEIEKFNLDIDKSYIIDGTNNKWKNQIQEAVLNIDVGYYDRVIVYTTHETGSKIEFLKSLKESNVDVLFIGDEAHGLGAGSRRKGLSDTYKYRIGLSATPSRWYDESGTVILEKYFGDDYYEFSISDALIEINPCTNKTFLVNYYYNIRFIDLTENELEQYKKMSVEITKLSRYSKESDEYADRLEKLLFKRSSIIKNAEGKYGELNSILTENPEIRDAIIFVSNEQIDKVETMLGKMKIPAHRLTEKEKNTPEDKYGGLTQRQDIINKFKKGYYKVLLAIKCLDEGIDIPSASCAILMASSTNPREYVQRIGRVIRQAENKTTANIYDISIRPCSERLGI